MGAIWRVSSRPGMVRSRELFCSGENGRGQIESIVSFAFFGERGSSVASFGRGNHGYRAARSSARSERSASTAAISSSGSARAARGWERDYKDSRRAGHDVSYRRSSSATGSSAPAASCCSRRRSGAKSGKRSSACGFDGRRENDRSCKSPLGEEAHRDG